MKKKKINSNNLLLLITIVLFFVMYAAGCIVYADKGFTRFQTFLNCLRASGEIYYQRACAYCTNSSGEHGVWSNAHGIRAHSLRHPRN